MMREKVIRGIALGFALLLTIVYFFFPFQESGLITNNSGRKKQELEIGENYRWSWTPEQGGTGALELHLSGMKKAGGITVRAEVLDAEEKVIASVDRVVAEMEEGADGVRLEGEFQTGRGYTLQVRAEGEGSIKLKGEEDDETEAFYPLITEYTVFKTRNIVLLYFAVGALLAAVTPVFGSKRSGTTIQRIPESRISQALPWATFALLAGMGIVMTIIRPMFAPGEPWITWDEETHWIAVQNMGLFSNGGPLYPAASMITWNPGYLPLAVGYNIAQIFTSSETVLYHAAIGFSAVTYAALCALAVKHAPRYKATFMVAGTMPTLLFQMTSATYDTVVCGSLLLGFALILETIDRKEPMTPARAITMVSVLAFGTVAKPAYSIALLCLLMIPNVCFDNRKRTRLFRIFVIVMLIWCVAAMMMPGAYDSVRTGDERFAGTSVSGQVEYMLANPVEGGLKPVRYVFNNWLFLVRAGIAHWAYMGGSSVMNAIYLWLLLAIAPLCTAGERWERKSLLTPRRRISFALIAIGAELILAYGQFLASSEVGGDVGGMQARYFIPVWCSMALALMWPQKIRQRIGRLGEWMTAAAFLACLGTNLYNLMMHLADVGLI